MNPEYSPFTPGQAATDFQINSTPSIFISKPSAPGGKGLHNRLACFLETARHLIHFLTLFVGLHKRTALR